MGGWVHKVMENRFPGLKKNVIIHTHTRLIKRNAGKGLCWLFSGRVLTVSVLKVLPHHRARGAYKEGRLQRKCQRVAGLGPGLGPEPGFSLHSCPSSL